MREFTIIVFDAKEFKPDPYVPVLAYMGGEFVSTAHWAAKANEGAGAWIGHCFNQSPPTFRLEEGAVTHWAYIKDHNGQALPTF